MFNSIMVGVDESPSSPRAVEAAARIAKTFSSTLHIVTAFNPATYTRDDELHPHKFHNLNHEDDADALLQKMSFVATKVGVEPVLHSSKGDPIDALVREAKELNVDLVVVGNLAAKGVRRVLGGVPSTIAHGVHCSVLIVDTEQ